MLYNLLGQYSIRHFLGGWDLVSVGDLWMGSPEASIISAYIQCLAAFPSSRWGLLKQIAFNWLKHKSWLARGHSFIWKVFLIIHWASSAVEFLKMYFIWFQKQVYDRAFALGKLTVCWRAKACIHKLNSNKYENEVPVLCSSGRGKVRSWSASTAWVLLSSSLTLPVRTLKLREFKKMGLRKRQARME